MTIIVFRQRTLQISTRRTTITSDAYIWTRNLLHMMLRNSAGAVLWATEEPFDLVTRISRRKMMIALFRVLAAVTEYSLLRGQWASRGWAAAMHMQ